MILYVLANSLEVLFFVENNFEEAIKFYSTAIELNPHVATYYGNRSFAYLKLESFGYALTDASKALELDNKYIKVGKGWQLVMWVTISGRVKILDG